MVRRGWSTLALVALLLGACGDDDDTPATSTSAAGAAGPVATLPDDVAPGTGALVLGDEQFDLDVVCTLDPSTDPATGVTTELAVDGGDQTGTVVSVTRQSTVGDVPTVTDTVAVEFGDTTLESQRVDAGGQLIDLRLPNPTERLIELVTSDTGSLVRAQGVFGPAQSLADDPANVEGSLIFRCP